MNPSIQFKTTVPTLKNPVSPSPLRRGFFLIPLVLGCFALSPTARAVSPAPDRGYPGNNTAEGDNALFSLTTGSNNTAIGSQALYSNTTGSNNTASGADALKNNTTGPGNTANGAGALRSNTTGGGNTANGFNALSGNTTGLDNTANGIFALERNTTGGYNTANGFNALTSNTTGGNNTASGVGALKSNTAGASNTANGAGALFSNTDGANNTAAGSKALFSNIFGGENTAAGSQALYHNTTGPGNTANGAGALFNNTTGFDNTANGAHALRDNTTGNNNTANGFNALCNNTTGSNNIALGDGAGVNLTTGNKNIDIGNSGIAGEGGTIRIGTAGTHSATYIAGISGAVGSGGSAVYVNSAGKLGHSLSSRRFKDEIKPMDTVSEAIHALKPVTFRYKDQLDPEGIPQFGLVAEDVEKVNPDLVARDAEGKAYTVRYEAVNAMLLNEFLKEHRKVEKLEATVAEQQRQIEILAQGLEKMNTQLELSKPAPQMVRTSSP